jgi:hypothetical protein
MVKKADGSWRPCGDYRRFKGAQVWDFDVLDFNDFFIMKSL